MNIRHQLKFEEAAYRVAGASITWHRPKHAPGAFALDSFGKPTIFLDPALTVASVYKVFIHELAHNFQPRKTWKVGGASKVVSGAAKKQRRGDPVEDGAHSMAAEIERRVRRYMSTSIYLDYNSIPARLDALCQIYSKGRKS